MASITPVLRHYVIKSGKFEDSAMMENYQEIKEIMNSLGTGAYQDFVNVAQGKVSDNVNYLSAPSPRELAIENVIAGRPHVIVLNQDI
jgi:hypothetical protein